MASASVETVPDLRDLTAGAAARRPIAWRRRRPARDERTAARHQGVGGGGQVEGVEEDELVGDRALRVARAGAVLQARIAKAVSSVVMSIVDGETPGRPDPRGPLDDGGRPGVDGDAVSVATPGREDVELAREGRHGVARGAEDLSLIRNSVKCPQARPTSGRFRTSARRPCRRASMPSITRATASSIAVGLDGMFSTSFEPSQIT
jgi:hypothetical protein